MHFALREMLTVTTMTVTAVERSDVKRRKTRKNVKLHGDQIDTAEAGWEIGEP